jgi:hypothetical protein
MAHFAQIDADNVVVQVLVVPDEQEHRGEEFLRDDLQLGGRWIQTSYNHRIRKQYAGIGYTYNPTADVFIAPQPAPWFTLNDNFDWVCPDGINPITGNPFTPDELLVNELEMSISGLVMPGVTNE